LDLPPVVTNGAAPVRAKPRFSERSLILVDRLEHRGSRPLRDLIFKGGNRERPAADVRLGARRGRQSQYILF
jgi:hypothetical protein